MREEHLNSARVDRRLNPWPVRILVALLRLRLRTLFRVWAALLGVDCGRTTWPQGLVLPHPFGIVIHNDATFGVDCTVYQNVTVGSRGSSSAAPRLGDRVTVFAGAVLLGAIRVGDDVVIGANAVVLNDVPAGSTVVGVPGRIVPAE